MSGIRKPPSLQSIAIRVIRRHYITSKRIVDVVRYFEKIDWMVQDGPLLKEMCIDFVRRAFQYLTKKYERGVLQEILGEELLLNLEANVAESEREIEKIKINGRVVDRKPFTKSSSEDLTEPRHPLARSVSGKAAYPYESLQEGHCWPPDVNASAREEYLDSDEFLSVFQIPYEQYRQFPKWKRIQIKKEKKLF